MRTTADSPTKVCTEDGCDRPLRARGMCTTHYNRQHQPNRHRKVEVACGYCGELAMKDVANTRAARFCSFTCRDLYALEQSDGDPMKAARAARAAKYPPKPKVKREPVDLRSPLHRALEADDQDAVIAAIKADTITTDTGCWEWQRRIRDGYASVIIGDRTYAVHRLSLEAKLGAPLGKQPAHHACANTMCVNPEHLVPVTAAANTAEMLARTYMVTRIRELEDALTQVAPHHPALAEVSLRATT